MFYQIISHTPAWVWALLAGLLWLGLKQTLTTNPSLKRITAMPVAMTGLSLFGTVSVFGMQLSTLAGWLTAAAVMAVATLQVALSPATRYDATLQRFTVPGSWVPAGLILGIFLTKYAVGVSLAMHPGLAHDATFGLWVPLLYGAFSGVFCGRAARLWRLAQRQDALAGVAA
jgi:hypothetical protein